MQTFELRHLVASGFVAIVIGGGCSPSVEIAEAGGGASGVPHQGGAGGGGQGGIGEPPTYAPPPAYWCFDYQEDPKTGLPLECCSVLVWGPYVDGQCPSPDELDPVELSNFPTGNGSGWCACGGQVLGPFGNYENNPQPCSYVAGRIPCDD
jgi:hypothetical protein